MSFFSDEGETVYIGFKFSKNLLYEAHKFYRALIGAHLIAYELGNIVVAQTEDIVMVDEIFKMTVNHEAGSVVGHCTHATEAELIKLEREYASKSIREQDTDQHDEGIRGEEG